MINVIVGPPCSGKSTYTEVNSKENDVIIDYDKIASAIGSNKPHDSDGSIRVIALRIRFSAIQRIIEGIDNDSWIIHTNPNSSLINQYVSAGGLFTVLDPGMDECIRRANKDNRPNDTIDAIERWYESPPEIPEKYIVDPITNRSRMINVKSFIIRNNVSRGTR